MKPTRVSKSSGGNSGCERQHRFFRLIGCALLAAAFVCGCRQAQSGRAQGYIEGEFVYVASPIAGALEKLACRRGQQVRAGEPLFALESGRENAALEETRLRLAQARATLEDARKGKRPSEMEALAAQLQQAKTALDFSSKELARIEELTRTKVATAQEMDRARTSNDHDRQRVTQLAAELETARLGARPDQVAAAEANVRAEEAAVAKAEWDLQQKKQSATSDGAVFDTLYREGEWIPAGRPVVVLLPPGNVKARAFVPQRRLGSLRVGNAVQVYADGATAAVSGKISFISPKTEFTPPVIYSRESREKLVFLVEIAFAPDAGVTLHPGQPVDVEFEK